jgi:thiol-disulfide isomerase/thioredoxin
MRALLLTLLVACGPARPTATVAKVPPVVEVEAKPTTPLGMVEAAADLDGAKIGAAAGKTTVLIVFASWCPHCHTELAILDELRAKHAEMRVVGVNYVGHEEYKGRGNPIALRAYLAKHAPWLRVVPADDELYAALGRPPKIPTIYVFDAKGTRVATFDRRERPKPTAEELEAVLAASR